jgi:alpha-amylase/alpha-mannosidase (GH57 family)
MKRYICIHGHFYQPPRENPWLDSVEFEDSAYPFHDWNERITAECYAPNASSRILGENREIINIVNNYAKISFNFGPTLISWLEKNNPEVYQAILQADNESQKKFSGHGSAIAQVYNHIIMPLASLSDKHTEVIWGIKDFFYRFNRRPEGMWLPETAVDYETLDVLAQHGILFTILAPHQAKQIRDLKMEGWKDVRKENLDTGMPYLCRLPTGRTITIFFYHHIFSNEIAFGKLLENGDNFVKRMLKTFPENQTTPRLLSIASDGETYGHHKRFADMAIAYALHTIETRKLAEITNFGEFLEISPPTHEVIIYENTSWSCSHGIERWRQDCGCMVHRVHNVEITKNNHWTGNQKPVMVDSRKWNQKWRKPLRDAMTWLNTNLSELFEEEGKQIFHSPNKARNEYIDLILNRSPEKLERFFSRHCIRTLSPEEVTKALKLLEMERNMLFMMTSCGWFFDEISGIETIQVMMYACRCMQLGREISGKQYEPGFTDMLQDAKSNIREYEDGQKIYYSQVKTAIVDINRVAFHYAITSLIEENPEKITVSAHTIRCHAYRKGEAGILKLCSGYATFRSERTLEESILTFAALHIGNHNFVGGIGTYSTEEVFSDVEKELWEAFSRSDVPGIIHDIDRNFESHSYSLWHLFKDGKRKVLYSILDSTMTDIETEYRQIYRRYFSLIRAMINMGIKPPEALEFPMQYTLNREIRDCLESEEIDLPRLKNAVYEILDTRYKPHHKILSYVAEKAMVRLMYKIEENPGETSRIENINHLFTIIQPLALEMDLWACQNYYFRTSMAMNEQMENRSSHGDPDAANWEKAFDLLGEHLGVRRR